MVQSGASEGAGKNSEESTTGTGVAEKEISEISTRILVVDDEEVVCRFLENLLVAAGHQVEVCFSGQDAVTKLRRRPYDLVITDLRMPGVDGVEVLRKAKELHPGCEVIIITAYASVKSAVEVMKLGAYDYISKPFNIDRIRMVVSKAMEKRTLLRAAEERDFYKRLSQIDALTEVYNYRAFQELMETEIRRAKRYGRPLSLLMIDLDHLKVVNDTFGHPVGDSILRQVAWLLKKSVRNCDVVARYGGDEFAVILIETDKDDAMSTASRLVRLVEGARFEQGEDFEGSNHRVTISTGLASFPADAREKADLVAKADQALYEAKTLGGNRVRGGSV